MRYPRVLLPRWARLLLPLALIVVVLAPDALWTAADAAFRATASSGSNSFTTGTVGAPTNLVVDRACTTSGAPALVGSASVAKPVGTTTVTVSKPTGTATGDLLVAFVNVNESVVPKSPRESGAAVGNQAEAWVSLGTAYVLSGRHLTSAFYRRAVSNEPASYTFTGGSAAMTVVVAAYSGVGTSVGSSGIVSAGYPYEVVGSGNTATVPETVNGSVAATNALLVMGIATLNRTVVTPGNGGFSGTTVTPREFVAAGGADNLSSWTWDQRLNVGSGASTVARSQPLPGGSTSVGWSLLLTGSGVVTTINTVTLSWSAPGASTVPVTGYSITRTGGAGPSAGSASGTSWIDTGNPSPATEYTYTVRSTTGTSWVSAPTPAVTKAACS